MLADALDHRLVVTAEDGIRVGGAGTFLADALRKAAAARGTTPPLVVTSACPGPTSRRAGPTTSSPASVSTASAWRRASARR